MPELPEVETVCEGLRRSITGQAIAEVKIITPRLRIPFPRNFAKTLKGRRIKQITRRAKYILIHLDQEIVWIMHLGMSGRVLIHHDPKPLKTHDHLRITFDDSTLLTFHDPRRFGLVTLAKEKTLPKHPLFAALGREPLEKSFNAAYLHKVLAKRSAPIKSLLMDQRIAAGVGNIYACEALFRSKIHPLKTAGTLTLKECGTLTNAMKQVLKEAIKSGGSTLRDYVRSNGDIGYFQHFFYVYNCTGKSCRICGTPIERITQQGRSTFFCPNCQKR